MSEPPTFEPRRHMPLEGTYNLRDTGGYATRDGRATRWHTFFRADNLHRLTPGAQTTLLERGLRTIIDLRRTDELQVAPNVFANSTDVTYHHISLLTDTVPKPGKTRTLVETYRLILDECQAQMAAVLSLLAASEAFPAMVHCTAGKDRTGVTVALMLGLAGVPEATIVEDYALTARYLEGGFVEETRQRALAREYTWEQYELLLGCPPNFMQETLQHLHERYGGIEAYVRGIGLNEAQISRLRTVLVA